MGAMRAKVWMKRRRTGFQVRLKKMLKCIFIGKQLKVDDIVESSESLATRDYSASGYSSRVGEVETKTNVSNIEEAESSLRESGYLNYEEARALLGRLEYQKGNMEAALHVFEGIDVGAVTPNIKVSLARRCELYGRPSQSDAAPPMSMHAVSLLLEAFYLKAKSLQLLGRFEEAARSCQVILDTVESAIPDGLHEKFTAGCKLLEVLNNSVELLPELWKLANSPREVISSYRRALLYHWNLELATRTRIEKEFAVFLLYSGVDANAPTFRFQAEGAFVPTNNIEEAILLLLILLRKFSRGRINWDPSILDHLSFAMSIAGDFKVLAHRVEELPPDIMDRNERCRTLALCYHGEGEDMVALNLLRNLLNDRENINCSCELLLALKISGESFNSKEGANYANEAIVQLQGKCQLLLGRAYYLLGISLSEQSKSVASDSRRSSLQFEALEALETAEKLTAGRDADILYYLAIENAEQRKLDIAIYYAKTMLKIEAGSSNKGWSLLARVLSAQKRYIDAETVVNAALDQTGKWDQAELLRTKAKLQIALGRIKDAIQTYTHVLAVLQVRKKGFAVAKKHIKSRRDHDRLLEMKTWHDLANAYSSLSQWRDAEVCVSKSEAIYPHSASTLHSRGLLHQARGRLEEALRLFWEALDRDPTHVPSLTSAATVLLQLGGQSLQFARSLLTEVIRIDRTNPCAWYNLGLLYKSELGSCAVEAAECFEAAAFLRETEPIEPFR